MTRSQRTGYSLCAAVLLFTACTDFSLSETKTDEEPKDLPDMEFRDEFRRVYYNGESREWELTSTHAKFFQRFNRTEVFDVTFYTYEGARRTYEITADYGIIHTGDNKVELYSNVVIVSSNRTRLETDFIIWNNKDKNIHTTHKVVITRPDGYTLVGEKGMTGDLGLDKVVIHGVEEKDESGTFGGGSPLN